MSILETDEHLPVVRSRWASAGSRVLSGGIKKAPPMSPLQDALLDPSFTIG
jgi:hypothetical protein